MVNESRVLAARLWAPSTPVVSGGVCPSAEDSAVWVFWPAGGKGPAVEFGSAAPWIEVEFLGDLEEPGAKRVRVERRSP